MAKKGSKKSKGKSSPKRSQPNKKSKVIRKKAPQRRETVVKKTAPAKKPAPAKKTPEKFITSKTPKTTPRPLRALKESAKSKQTKALKPAPKVEPKPRNYAKTRTYKNFARQYKRKADKEYWKDIQKEFKLLYDKKGQPLRIVLININKKFVHNTKNRLKETKRKYWGKEKWRKDKEGKWKEGKATLRNMYRDRLRGNYLKGEKVGIRFLKVMERDLVRKYMKRHRIKNYNKAKKKFWQDAETKSIYSLVRLYGGSP